MFYVGEVHLACEKQAFCKTNFYQNVRFQEKPI